MSETRRKLLGAAPTRATAPPVTVTRIETPIGPMLAGASDAGVCLLEFVDRRMIGIQGRRLARQLRAPLVPGASRHLDALADEMRRYFAGELRRFGVPLDLRGTAFQERAWRALLRIPYGETRSYAGQARLAGAPTATRAVARANGANRIAIVVPCHRVVGADGALTGYGGGLWRKQFLLDLERGFGPMTDTDSGSVACAAQAAARRAIADREATSAAGTAATVDRSATTGAEAGGNR
jgi:AraC family transcriptional regulator of adaptative response/methylated-DNA-[protein]-cysteine methyltransferase